MVNISLRDKETHFDQRPSHRPVSRAVRDALAHAQDCVREYNDRIDEMFTPGTPHPDWTEIARLGSQANAAEMALAEARDAALNECSCKPDSDACPVCVAANRQKYGDEIPFRGE